MYKVVTIIAALMFAASVQAGNKYYAGIAYNAIDMNLDSNINVSLFGDKAIQDEDTGGTSFIFGFHTPNQHLDVELEYLLMSNVNGSHYTDLGGGAFISESYEYEASTFTVWAVGKKNFTDRFSGSIRGGLAYADREVSATLADETGFSVSDSSSDSGVGFGLGLGLAYAVDSSGDLEFFLDYKLYRVGLDFEGTDEDFEPSAFALGARFHF